MAMERLGHSPTLDAEGVARVVEFTRFATCGASADRPEARGGRLVQAADLIGQLGDPPWNRRIEVPRTVAVAMPLPARA
jgi:hypothetical protein